MKEATLIVVFVFFLALILGTAFLPVILSIILGSWWYMALYLVIWGVVVFEVILALGTFAFLEAAKLI